MHEELIPSQEMSQLPPAEKSEAIQEKGVAESEHLRDIITRGEKQTTYELQEVREHLDEIPSSEESAGHAEEKELVVPHDQLTEELEQQIFELQKVQVERGHPLSLSDSQVDRLISEGIIFYQPKTHRLGLNLHDYKVSTGIRERLGSLSRATLVGTAVGFPVGTLAIPLALSSGPQLLPLGIAATALATVLSGIQVFSDDRKRRKIQDFMPAISGKKDLERIVANLSSTKSFEELDQAYRTVQEALARGVAEEEAKKISSDLQQVTANLIRTAFEESGHVLSRETLEELNQEAKRKVHDVLGEKRAREAAEKEMANGALAALKTAQEKVREIRKQDQDAEKELGPAAQ